MKAFITALTIFLMLAAPAIADTIYIWTDKDGVKRFSDQLPDNVEEYETVQGSSSAPASDADVRPGLKKMLGDVEQEKKAIDQRKAVEAAKRDTEKKEKPIAEKEAKVQAERARLQKEIDKINNRALSPTFTKGMRNNQIKEIQKQMDALEKPE